MTDTDSLQSDLLERVEDETGVRLDPDEHVRVEDGRATLTEAGADALSARKPRGSGRENRHAIRHTLNSGWDRFWSGVANRINSALPEWARYEGYGTYALAAYLYTAAALALAIVFWLGNIDTAAIGLTASSIIGLLIGGYYRGAAKARVVCDQCGEPARGESECPHCGGPTFMGETA